MRGVRMKVLIDIAEEEYLMIKTKIITGDDGYLDRAVADGIQIPDNATNEIETIIRRYTDEQTN